MLGDERAFREIVERYHQQLYRLVWYQFEDTGEVEDIVQETFLKLWQKPHLFDASKGRFSHWISHVCQRHAISYWRKNQSHLDAIVSDKDGVEPISDQQQSQLDDADPLLQELIHQHSCTELKQALHQLPLVSRQVVVLFYFEHESQAAIATMLKLSPRSVEAQLYRARKKIRQLLQS